MNTASILALPAGLEAINYQGPSGKLAEELIAHFNTIFKLKEDKSFLENRLLIKVIRETVQHRSFNLKLASIIEKHTGLRCYVPSDKKPLIEWLVDGPSYNLTMRLHVTSEFRDSGGFGNYRTENPTAKELQAKLLKTREALNKDTGKVTKRSNLNSVVGDVFGVIACCDSSFLVDKFHEQAICPTAEEITAGWLHEIGHVISVIDYASTMHRSLSAATQPVKISTKSIEDAKKAVKELKQDLSTVASVAGTSDNDKRDSRIILELEDILADAPKFNMFKFAICWFINIFYTILKLRMNVKIAINIWANTILTDISDLLKFTNNPKTKSSDFKTTAKGESTVEYRADEYVAAFGLSDMLAKFIMVTKTNMLITGSNTEASKFAPVHPRQSMIKYNLELITMLTMAPYNNIARRYGMPRERYDTIGKNILKQLRASNIHPAIEADLIRQYENIQTLIVSMNKRPSQLKFPELSAKINKAIITLGGVGKLLTTRNGEKKYDALVEAADTLTNGTLVYQYKRLTKR